MIAKLPHSTLSLRSALPFILLGGLAFGAGSFIQASMDTASQSGVPRAWLLRASLVSGPAMAGAPADTQALMAQAELEALDGSIGTPVRWQNPRTGDTGSVIPLLDRMSANGRWCRELQVKSVVDGTPREITGTQCVNRDLSQFHDEDWSR